MRSVKGRDGGRGNRLTFVIYGHGVVNTYHNFSPTCWKASSTLVAFTRLLRVVKVVSSVCRYRDNA